jgi:ubiquinone/menaquinone biosynthesis C-methylase UbiE
LAAGGGWQSILYATAGAEVTVVDISPGMLELDQREAKRRNLNLKLCEGSMDDLGFLQENSFDIVHHPVSSCYVPDISKVYAEVATVIKDHGLYISQHKQPTSMQIVDRDQESRYLVGIEYYHAGPLPEVPDKSYREPNAKEYLHRWEDLVGGLARTGFIIEDLREPYRGKKNAPPGDFHHRGRFTPPYVRILARRKSRSDQLSKSQPTGNLWLP